MGLVEQIVEIHVREAVERVVEAKNKKFVTDMLRYTDYSIENIAFLADVPDSFVEKINENLRGKRLLYRGYKAGNGE